MRIRNTEISAPTPGIFFGQLAFALIDTVMAALTLYVLLPQAAPNFLTFFAVFAAATMVGVLRRF